MGCCSVKSDVNVFKLQWIQHPTQQQKTVYRSKIQTFIITWHWFLLLPTWSVSDSCTDCKHERIAWKTWPSVWPFYTFHPLCGCHHHHWDESLQLCDKGWMNEAMNEFTSRLRKIMSLMCIRKVLLYLPIKLSIFYELILFPLHISAGISFWTSNKTPTATSACSPIHEIASTVTMRERASEPFIREPPTVSAATSAAQCGELVSQLCQKPISLSHCSSPATSCCALSRGAHLTLIYDIRPEQSPRFSSLTSDVNSLHLLLMTLHPPSFSPRADSDFSPLSPPLSDQRWEPRGEVHWKQVLMRPLSSSSSSEPLSSVMQTRRRWRCYPGSVITLRWRLASKK